MPDLWEQIAVSLRHRARRLVTLRGAAWTGLVAVCLLWVVGLADWLLHLDAPWLRALLAAGVVGGIGLTIWKTLWRPLHVRLSDVDVARSIERRFPRWGDQLSSAAQFRGEQFSERLGSPDLQQAITAGVDERLSQIDTAQVLDPVPTRRLALCALMVCVLGVSLALWQRSAAATALARLALPFSDVEWPRATQLQFLDEELKPLEQSRHRIAAGEPFALYLENALGSLPDDVRLQLRLADGRSEERSLQVTSLRDGGGRLRAVGIISLSALEGPVHFRGVGGDDLGMRWFELEVVPAPALVDLELTVTPPEYAAQPPRTITGAGQIEALVGSRVQIVARANARLQKADLRREGHPPQPMTLTDDGRRVEVDFEIAGAGHAWYWFDIADEQGLSPGSPPRYELRGVADRKPTVYVDQPVGDVTLTPDAVLPLRVIARDDLGIRTLRLVHSRPGLAPSILPLRLTSPMPTEYTVETHFDLRPLQLQSGDRMTFHAAAVDAFDLAAPAGQELPEQVESPGDGPGQVSPVTQASQAVRPTGEVGQVGLSAFRHIEILSTEQKRKELSARQSGVLDALRQLQQQQSRAAESTAGLRIQSELADRLQEGDLDLLKQTELEQQQIREQLGDRQTGAHREVERLRAELQHNGIDDPQMAGRLDQLSEDLRSLTEDLLPSIEQSLARARKSSQPGDDSGRQTSQQLQQAEQSQSQALSLLEEATRQLGGWQRQFQITSALEELTSDQATIQEQTQETGRQTLTKRPEALAPQQQADLARLSDRQRRLAARLEELLSHASQPPEQTPGKADAADPESKAVQRALSALAERRTVTQMHSAAESLRRNDIAATSAAQQQVLDDLRQFGELLQSDEAEAVDSLLSSLQQQRDDVETLRKQQKDLLQKARQALGPSADPEREQQLEQLRKRQQELADQADELARQLRRQQLQQSAGAAARAARRMREAQQSLQQQQAEPTAAAQNEALDDLEQLAEDLARRQEQIERELARQQIEQLAADLQELADRQEELTTLTLDLDDRRQERGAWSRSLRRELQEITEAQTAAADRLDELRRAVSGFAVIDLSLLQAADPMRAAIEQLKNDQAGPPTQQQQRTARQRLIAIVDVIAQAQQPAEAPTQSAPPQSPDQPAQDDQPQVPQLLGTQLRLLRHLQADVRQRTEQLARDTEGGEMEQDQLQQQRQQLAAEQQRIAELVRGLLAQFADTQQEAPEGDQP